MEDAYEPLEKHAVKSAEELVQKLKEQSFTLALAESCTAGQISTLLAAIPGASQVLWGTFLCYTQEAKVRMLDLDFNELNAYGLVSSQTACSMAESALERSGADIAAGCTGLAGPDGDGSNVPVGTVWVATARKDGDKTVKKHHFDGSRNEIRLKAAIAVLETVKNRLT